MAEDTGPLDNSAGAQPLFQQEDGTAIAFYIRPGATKVKVAPLIHRHGGHLCSTQVPGAVLLAWPGEVPAGAPGEYISAQYVTDCVMGKKKLPLEHYRLAPAPTVRSSAEGRMHFTEDEDRAILRYVQSKDQAQATSAGNVLWKEMAQAQVTQHSWQAMRDRYLKQLRGKEEMYLLPPSTKRRALDPDPGSGVRVLQIQKRAAEPLQEVGTVKGSKECSIFQMANKEFEDSEQESESPSPKESLSPQRIEPSTSGKASSNPQIRVAEDTSVPGSQSPRADRLAGPSADEVAAAVEDLKCLMEEFGVSLEIATQALLKNSGEVAAGKCCLQTGQRPDGGPLWSRQDDVDLLKGDCDLRSKLVAKYGAEHVNRRLAFRKN